ncbi:1-deoxy-D-xylulose 5-phosphate reductoisomerase [Verrucomicrobia bacterium SCGC AG-212-E04]|nr:1-deoxy-D-xylulose 5-phosphate reductoisomerase [Verrucomicrobia bacterium SCGC AG-212-E04]
MSPRRVIVLGATGSIGESAAKVARDLPERVQLTGLAAHSNAAGLAAQANEFRPAALCLVDESKIGELRAALASGYSPTILTGEAGLVELAATAAPADIVLIAIVGTGGLRPALAAIEAGRDLAVASKEILVMAGEAVMGRAAAKGVRVLPVDSEHNAIFQCLEGRDPRTVKRLILTASGGPFRTASPETIASATRAQALKHPTWNMGAKISIDSATLFNKGLEMIEARWLFDVEMDRVDVVVHPQSIVHSMVEFVDGSVLAQLSHSDMCFPIQYAICWPERVPNRLPPLDFATLRKLDFEPPRRDVFPALDLAAHAGRTGGTLPAVMNAANEIAVAAFLADRIPFTRIWSLVKDSMQAHEPTLHASLEQILDADLWARKHASTLL